MSLFRSQSHRKQIKTLRRFNQIENLEERRVLDGVGLNLESVPDHINVYDYFPTYASPAIHGIEDEYSDQRVLNYGYYASQQQPTGQNIHRNEPAAFRYVELEDSEAELHANDTFATSELVPLGFDSGETTQIDIRGNMFIGDELEPDTIGGGIEDDGSILLATETDLLTNGVVRTSGFIGDGPHGFTTGDFDYYAVRNVEEGQILTVAITPDLLLSPYVAIYNSLGELKATQSIRFLNEEERAGFGTFGQTFFTLVYEAEEDDDYFVSIGGAVGLGFFLPQDPFQSDSGLIPLTVGSYDVLIGLDVEDEDYYRVELDAGDILGITSRGAIDDLRVYNSAGEMMVQSYATQVQLESVYPPSSPLPTEGKTGTAFVAPESGTYYVRGLNSDFFDEIFPGFTVFPGFVPESGFDVGPGNYEIRLRLFRPDLEEQEQGNHQILFLDFDGQEFNNGVFEPVSFLGIDGGYPVELSPLRTFMGGWGLTRQDTDAVIDAIIAQVEEDFRDIGLRGNNGDFVRTGRHGDYRIEIRNSRDHADPYGQKNVSRIIVGGSQFELGIPGLLGIAESIDVGNFNTEETAVVVLDVLSSPGVLFTTVDLDGDGTPDDLDGDGNPDVIPVPNGDSVNNYLVTGNKTVVDLVGRMVGTVVSHEAGHFFGAWHTSPNNEVTRIMDSTGDAQWGIGPDRILGTQDDEDIDFGVDEYSENEFHNGVQDTLNTFAFGLSTGTKRGSSNSNNNNNNGQTVGLSGRVWEDTNGNGSIDPDENGLNDFIVYADLNGDKRYNISEPAARTNSRGAFNIAGVTQSNFKLRVVNEPGYVVTFPNNGEIRFINGEPVNNTNLRFGFQIGEGSDEGFDYGDAPASFPSASHGIIAGFSLGTEVDGESGSLTVEDGDDGIVFLGDIFAGATVTAEVSISNGAQPRALLQGWIDFDGNGSWSSDEQVFKNVGVSEGINRLDFTVPESATTSTVYGRFRYGYEPDLGPGGRSVAGEVEDYGIMIVPDGPTAFLDSFTVRENSDQESLSVLANDETREGVTISVTDVTTPTNNGLVEIGPGGQSILYTPAADTWGLESFSYTITDSNGKTDSASVTINVLPNDARLSLEITDSSGNPISRLGVGDDFILQGKIQDLRDIGPTGVFAAFMDITYPADLATVTGPIVYGPEYPNGQSGDTSEAGFIDEIGAFDGLARTGDGVAMLFSVPMQATSEGDLVFNASPADILPAHNVLLFVVGDPVPFDKIEYGSTMITVSSESVTLNTNPLNPLDVNGDSTVSAFDALLVINRLNSQRPSSAAAQSPEDTGFQDVNGDGFITAIDALLVINFLNRGAVAATADVHDEIFSNLDDDLDERRAGTKRGLFELEETDELAF